MKLNDEIQKKEYIESIKLLNYFARSYQYATQIR